MRLAFINPNRHDYDVDTPYERPLAGGESGQVYLAAALAAKGHEVHLFTDTSQPGFKRGVHCRSYHDDPPWDDRAAFDAVIVSSGNNMSQPPRSLFGPEPLILAWPQDIWHPDPTVTGWLTLMTGPRDFILCVSPWYRQHIIAEGAIRPDRTVILGHGISPVFESLFAAGEPILAAKPNPSEEIVLAFTSSPYKGLEPALALFKALKPAIPKAVLRIYSGFDHYPPDNVFRKSPDQWESLYRACRDTEGVEMVGVIPQGDLARALKASHIYFYPNVAREGFGIAVAEAMAAGCHVITSNLGALPQVVGGFGDCVAFEGGQLPAGSFLRATTGAIARLIQDPEATEVRRRQQVDFCRNRYSWTQRAAEFEAILARLQAS
ncbi:MAG: glycosyltransferase family 4 protein [Magnetovibrionaceae bacterium]